MQERQRGLRGMRWIGLVFLGVIAGCSADSGAGPAGGGPDAGDGDPPAEPTCGTAAGTLPAGLTELTYDSGEAAGSVLEERIGITYNNVPYVLREEQLHEAVRFDIERPAKIFGFRVKWDGLDELDAETELTAGLYRDFGHNGMDFWAPDPISTGSRCAGDAAEDGWHTYTFANPIVIDHPAPVYVAHRAAPGAPVFAFDDNPAKTRACDEFSKCHSVFNLPEVKGMYNGLTFPTPNNFLVRLYVAYEEPIAPADRIFVEAPGSPSAKHVSFGDYDNDGWDDALLDGRLYRNVDGVLTDVSADAGVLPPAGGPATGGVFGDYDNDGCLDLFLFIEEGARANMLLRSNCDGTFTDATATAGIVDEQSYETCGSAKNVHSPAAAAGWADFDADGFLDLYVANYICYSQGGRPETYYEDAVFHNNGDGTFTNISGKNGFSADRLASRGVAPVDADGDGDIDLFINHYRLQPNWFFENQGDGQFVERAIDAGVAGVRTREGLNGYYGHTIGAAWGDLDNDGDFDLIAANLAHPRFFHFSDKTQILLNDGKGNFTDRAGTWEKPESDSGLRYQETYSAPVLGDFDQDGALDLAITAVYDGRPTDFYRGNGDGTFVLDTYRSGLTTKDGWGIAAADLDHDGDLDLFDGHLFVNQLPASKRGHSLQVRVVGDAGSNRAGIGAVVTVEAGGRRFVRQVQGGSGKGNQDAQTLHFGLGSATSVDAVTVRFPGRDAQRFAGPFDVDRRLWIHESGTVKEGFAPPP